MRNVKKNYILAAIAFLTISFSSLLFLDTQTVFSLGKEEGIFEYLTAFFFLITTVIFFVLYIRRKSGNNFWLFRTRRNLFILMLGVIFFVGFGEEINWFQGIFNLQTPPFMKKINVQKEINIHNIITFNTWDFEGKHKTGLANFFTANRLYNFFWLIYCVLIPLAAFSSASFRNFLKRLNLPVVPVWIGLFFLLNWLVYKIMNLLFSESFVHQYTLGEIKECNYSFLFLMIGIYMYFNLVSTAGDVKAPSALQKESRSN